MGICFERVLTPCFFNENSARISGEESVDNAGACSLTRKSMSGRFFICSNA